MVIFPCSRRSSHKNSDNKGVVRLIDNIVLPACCQPQKNSENSRQHGVVILLPTPKATLGVSYGTPVLSGWLLDPRDLWEFEYE